MNIDILDFWFLVGLGVCVILAILMFLAFFMLWQMIYHDIVKDNPSYIRNESAEKEYRSPGVSPGECPFCSEEQIKAFSQRKYGNEKT